MAHGKIMKATTIIILFSFIFQSCNYLLCGELTGEWKNKLEKANEFSASLKVENIPCEFYYINVIATTKLIDTSAIHSLHKYLYDEKSKVGWQVLLVHDAEWKYLFSHRYDNSIFLQ
jgi:hypothetical protein